MNEGQVYKMIEEIEERIGENIFDEGFYLDPKTFMTWCLGRKYLSIEKYNMWLSDWLKNELDAIDAISFVYSEYGEVEYAVVISEDYEEDKANYARKILAEFISEIDVYEDRLNKFHAKYC